jgi:hypothetical protein
MAGRIPFTPTLNFATPLKPENTHSVSLPATSSPLMMAAMTKMKITEAP